MNWYQYLEGDIAADFNKENNNRELIAVSSAFKKCSIHSKQDTFKYVLDIGKEDLSIFKNVLKEHFKFNRYIEYAGPSNATYEIDPFIYYSAESYINGFTHDGDIYQFYIYTMNMKTYNVLMDKFKEAKAMDEALK